MKRVRTKSSDKAGNMEPPKKPNRTKSSDLNDRLPSPIDTSGRSSPKSSGTRSPIASDADAKLSIKVVSYGRAHGPVADPEDNEEMLKFSVRDVANPPAKLRKTYTGLSPRLRKEIFSDKAARAKYDLFVTEIEKMMKSMETAMAYDEAHQDEDNDTSTMLIVCIECEEGKHRSVAYADELARSVGRKGWAVSVEHRDLGISEADGLMGDDDDDLDEPLTPSSPGPKETVKAKKKKDKNMKKRREQRLRVEAADSGAEEGYM